MIQQTYIVTSSNINPYMNLAKEAWLFNHLPEHSMILFLWQNHHTVVIGKNQNAYKECYIHEMEKDHCYLARRNTGGGAVYHDLGNLNFTIICHDEDYDLKKQFSIILNALKSFGIEANISGRNDLEILHRKFSGNAFLHKDQKRLHHGTLLIHSDMDKIGKYLKVSDIKLQSKGVSSVEARVINLSDLNSDINPESLKESLIRSFEQVYEMIPKNLEIPAQYTDYVDQFYNWNFIYNKIPEYTFVIEDRLSFGEVQLYVHIVNDYLMNVQIYTDSLHTDIVEKLSKYMNYTIIQKEAFSERIEQCAKEDILLKEDISQLFSVIEKRFYAL